MHSRHRTRHGLSAAIAALVIGASVGALFVTSSLSADSVNARHVVVFQESGRYGGWPANQGAWVWGNEIVVGFDDGDFLATQKGHTLRRDVSPKQKLARSVDGGETWTIEEPADLRLPSGVGYQGSWPPGEGRPLSDAPGGLDFTHPDMAFTARMTTNPGVSRFYYSQDRGRTWQGPYKLPNFGRAAGTAARTDYIVNGKHDLSLVTTLAKENGKEGRQAEGDRISTGRGNPASLIRLKDGRLVLTYGYRAEPNGIRARVSADGGRTWQPEIVLRSDGGNTDLGYARSVQRADGKVVTIYYYNLDPAKERFIGATIWQP